MNDLNRITLFIAPDAPEARARQLSEQFPRTPHGEGGCELTLRLDGEGLSLVWEDQVLRGDFSRLLPRLKQGISKELLVRAAKIKDPDGALTALDATAGLGEDSFFLAAAGFEVSLFEHNPVIFALLQDAVDRALSDPATADIAGRMHLFHRDSAAAMRDLERPPHVILLDPMFPARQKSALVKKKLQMIQKLESPCLDEKSLLLAAAAARPKKLIIKRPPKGPYLAGVKPDHSIEGKAVRFDCIVSPGDKLHKIEAALG